MKLKLLLIGLVFTHINCYAATYASKLCKSNPSFNCVSVKRGQSWNTLFKDPEQREIVKRINRMSAGLYAGMTIAVPKNFNSKSLLDFAPFPARMPAVGENYFIYDPKILAWGAYDGQGNLVKWGPAVSGKEWCSDINQSCRTESGKFRVYSKRGAACISNKFPIRANGINGGAPMPYCNFFNGGYAVHAGDLPGYHASHGCVRTFKEDAKWLDSFMRLGTPVDVRPYS